MNIIYFSNYRDYLKLLLLNMVNFQEKDGVGCSFIIIDVRLDILF